MSQSLNERDPINLINLKKEKIFSSSSSRIFIMMSYFSESSCCHNQVDIATSQGILRGNVNSRIPLQKKTVKVLLGYIKDVY